MNQLSPAEERRAELGKQLVLELQARGKLPLFTKQKAPAGAAWARAALSVLTAIDASSPVRPGGQSAAAAITGRVVDVVGPGGVEALRRGDLAGAAEASVERYLQKVASHVNKTLRDGFDNFDEQWAARRRR